MRGNTGTITGLALLESLEKLGCSGTLALEQEGNLLLLLLNNGELGANHKLGHINALDSHDLAFHFEPHAPSDVPQFGTRFPRSVLGLLRAVPALGTFARLPAYNADLLTLFTKLQEDAFTGLVSLETPSGQSLVLFLLGKLGAAFYDDDGYVREGTAALRALRRTHLNDPGAQLFLRTFGTYLVQSLLGMALAQAVQEGADDVPSFSGLESSETGYTYFDQGRAVLHVASELRGRSGRYALCDTPPDLPLPENPPGWEHKRYRLTLRGRDALNPMTELSLRFSDSSGKVDKKVLEHLGQGLTLESVAQYLGLELGELTPHLQKLEREGLIRQQEG